MGDLTAKELQKATLATLGTVFGQVLTVAEVIKRSVTSSSVCVKRLNSGAPRRTNGSAAAIEPYASRPERGTVEVYRSVVVPPLGP
jgi:hypothetical protein